MNVTFFTGITGMDKSNFIQKIIERSGKQDEIMHIEFEDELTNSARPGTTPVDMPSFLDMKNPYLKMKIISDAFEWISQKIAKNQPDIKHIFFSIHLSYYKNSEFFPPFNQHLFSSFIAKIPKPNVKIITLIDDVFSIWQRIKQKEQEVFIDTSLRLREILAWRSLETLRSESLNTGFSYGGEGILSVNNFLVSIRHPYETFHNLIFVEKPKTIYLSYSITSTRETPEGIGEINDYRKELHGMGKDYNIAIFDPVTIDELSLVIALDSETDSSKEIISLKEEHRWPLSDSNPIIHKPNFPIEIPKQEIEEVKRDISNQIQARDYALADAAQILAVYRPYHNGVRSDGVDAEIKHAKESGNRVVVYSLADDESKAGLTKGSPFASNTDYFQVKKEFIAHLQKLITIH